MKKNTILVSCFLLLLAGCITKQEKLLNAPVDIAWVDFSPVTCQFGQANDLVSFNDQYLWILGTEKFVKYSVHENTCDEYFLQTDRGEALPLDIYVDSDNNLWAVGVNHIAEDSLGVEENWILWEFEETTDQFNPIKDVEGNLRNALSYSFDIAEGNDNAIWLLGANKELSFTLLSYSPETNASIVESKELSEELSFLSLSGENIFHIASDQKGRIWMSVANKNHREENDQLWKIIRVDPKNSQIKNFGSPPGALMYPPPSLHVDSGGRLWTSAISWLDFDCIGRPTWSPIIKPSELVIRVSSPSGFSWEPPTSFYETADGRFWITSPAGLTVYEPISNLWHRVSMYPHPVVEDDSGRVWYVGENRIYLLEIP